MGAQHFLLDITKNISPSGSSRPENHLPKYSGSNPQQYSFLFIENLQLTVTNIQEKYPCKRKAVAHHAVFPSPPGVSKGSFKDITRGNSQWFPASSFAYNFCSGL